MTELRKHELATLKSQAEKQIQFFQKFTKRSETITLASYQLAWNIARAKKPYNEGEFVKKCLSDVVEILSPENDKLKRMVSDVQLSRHAVEHRISDINTAIESQLHSDLEACEYFSVALDESCDIQDKPQLAIFARSVSNDCVIKELLDIVPLKDRTRGIDVKETMMAAFEKANLPITKLTAIATDGAPAMMGSVNGLVGLCKADQTIPDFWNFHCIIHMEQLVSKSLNLDNVMKPVMEIVNYIRTHALNHRQFKNLIAELDQGLPGDLPLHCTVRWLSKGQVLSRFFELLDAVKLFMEEKDKNCPVLSDLKWIMDLAFLVDMLCHLDRLNLTVQGKLKMLPDLVQGVFAFVNKLKLFKAHIQKVHLTHFPTLLKASGQVASPALSKQRARYATLIENLHESFVTRFHDLQLKRPQITFLVDPFNAETGCLKVPLVTDEAAAELEMIDLCEEDQLKPALREGTIEFWKSVPMEKYPNVKRAALKILSMFGSTYVCESVFSTLKHVKSKHRSVLTDTHVKELLRVATTEYKPDLKRIVPGKECQKSH
ncbi:general transcription factor II-I repeat domain-containing protein 2 [Oreochromis niloticus]|uniref:general transcription factor II-I repeat domain-containing protein 2 n=1 Tax=Oreochromis niloticus TaxID=8128 RepID=UPI000904FA0F|nr:general transcription factor II-I repeat domain-containing protein 2 [Oreochromis niloticus]